MVRILNLFLVAEAQVLTFIIILCFCIKCLVGKLFIINVFWDELHFFGRIFGTFVQQMRFLFIV